MEAETEEEQPCLICNKKMKPGQKIAVIQERGINSLIKASKRREDRKSIQFKKYTVLQFHQSCATAYVRASSINAAIKKKKKRKSEGTSEQNKFEFDERCLFCGFEVRETRGNCAVVLVSKSETKDSILSWAEERSTNIKNSKEIYDRLNNAEDLVELEARYHLSCAARFYDYQLNRIPERADDEPISNALQFVIDYMQKKSEECQFSLSYILGIYKGDNKPPDNKRLIEKLLHYMGGDIVVHPIKDDYIVCLVNPKDNIVMDYNCKDIGEEEKLKILEAAGKILREDIRLTYYDTNSLNSEMPENLKFFLDILVKSYKKANNAKQCERQVEAIGHSMISSVRPSSFKSSVLLGITEKMHKDQVPKEVIDCFHNLGFCAPYDHLSVDAKNTDGVKKRKK